jgi:hypothetical protein
MAESTCKSCKQKGPRPIQIGSIALGFYVLSTSIYGSVKLFQLIVSLIN